MPEGMGYPNVDVYGNAENLLNNNREEATEDEERQKNLITTMVEEYIHGRGQSNVLKIMESSGPLGMGISQAGFGILDKINLQAKQEGNVIEPAVWFGENGAIQETAEMLFELAEAAGLPGSDDDEQLAMGYMDLMRRAGEVAEKDDPVNSKLEAQDLLAEMSTIGGQPATEATGLDPNTGQTMLPADPLSHAIEQGLDPGQQQALMQSQGQVVPNG